MNKPLIPLGSPVALATGATGVVVGAGNVWRGGVLTPTVLVRTSDGTVEVVGNEVYGVTTL